MGCLLFLVTATARQGSEVEGFFADLAKCRSGSLDICNNFFLPGMQQREALACMLGVALLAVGRALLLSATIGYVLRNSLVTTRFLVALHPLAALWRGGGCRP